MHTCSRRLGPDVERMEVSGVISVVSKSDAQERGMIHAARELHG